MYIVGQRNLSNPLSASANPTAVQKETQSYGKTVPLLIRRVREMLLPHFGKVAFREKTSVRKNDFVTELDFTIEKFLKEELARLYPDIAFVGEEGGGDRTEERFWLVDPIDGTDHFIRGLPFCTTMLALIERGTVVFSVIYDFVHDIMYVAEKGKGAFANGKPIQVNNRPLNGSRLTWDSHLEKPGNMSTFLRLWGICSLFDTGASGYAFPMIASGKLDGRICFDAHHNDYDYAPGILLVSEAGGEVANIGSQTFDYRNGDIIAANPTIFKELTEGPDALFPIARPS